MLAQAAQVILTYHVIKLGRLPMAKGGKERIIPPSRKDVREASKETKEGSGPGGRVLVEKRIAKQQGVKRPKP